MIFNTYYYPPSFPSSFEVRFSVLTAGICFSSNSPRRVCIHSALGYQISPIMHFPSLIVFLAGFGAVNAATIPSGICGEKGYSIGDSYYYDESGANANLAACGTICKADKECKSFAFGGEECDLYTQTVASNVEIDSGSPYTFYDISCVGTTSSSTISSRTSSTSSTPTASLTCGVAGYDKTATYNSDGSVTNANLNACSAKCKADSQCLSFAIGSGDCLLYAVSAGTNIDPVAGSPYTFYDKNCPVPGTSSTTATPSSTTETSSSTSITPTTTTATGVVPTGTFCLQLTGSGQRGTGSFVYYNTTNKNFMVPAEAVNFPTSLFTVNSAGSLFTTDGSQVVLTPASGGPSTAILPLQKAIPNTGSQNDSPLGCSENTFGNLLCTSTAGAQVFSIFAFQDAGIRTDQVVYLQTSSGTYSQSGFTIMDSCPTLPYAPPGLPTFNGFCGTTFPCPSSTTTTTFTSVTSSTGPIST